MLLNLFDCGIKLRLIDDVEVIIEKALSLDSGLSEARKCLEVIKNTKLNGGLVADDLIESRELNLQVENFIREGLLDYALDSVMGVLEKYPKDYRALNNQGLIYWYQGEIKIAITHFQTSIELNPWYTDAILNLYDCSLLVGEIQNFNPVLDRCIQIYPTNPELLQARKEIQLGQIPERLSSYRDNHQEKTREKTLLAQAQDFITDLLNEGKELAEAYNALGIISFYWGNFDDAKNLVTRSLSLQPLNEDALLNLWDICIKLDDVYFARKTLSDALSMDPGLSQVQSILNGGAL
jgi:tetratricopeptide (TPR) repeat protein